MNNKKNITELETQDTLEKYDDRDFIRKWDIIETPSKNFLSEKITYDQNDIHKNSCFVHWPFWCISDITWYRFTDEERKAVVDYAWTTPFADPEWWWYLSHWMKWAVNAYNRKFIKKHKLIYYRIPIQDFDKFLDKWYSINCGYHTSREFSRDKLDDWIINFSWWKFAPWEWWHCVRMFKQDWKYKIVNNYPSTSKYNIFEIENPIELFESWIMFQYWYVTQIKEKSVEWWDVKDWYEGLSLKDKVKKLNNRKEVKKKREEILKNKNKK